MAAVAAPYGFLPVNLIGGQVYSGSFRQIAITTNEANSIFYGDPVTIVAGGTIEGERATTSVDPIGIFMGCTYTDSSLNYKVHNQMWLGGTVASDGFAYVCDDPDMVFQVQADGAVTQAELGENAAVITYAEGNNNIGKSILAITQSTIAPTATLPFRIVGFVDGPDSSVGDAFTDCLVKWNFGIHLYEGATGI